MIEGLSSATALHIHDFCLFDEIINTEIYNAEQNTDL